MTIILLSIFSATLGDCGKTGNSGETLETTPLNPPPPSVSTSEVSLSGDSIPCNTQTDAAEYDCLAFKAMVDADDPETMLDDPLEPTPVILVVRKKKDAPWSNRWIVFEAGGHGRGYGITFGNVTPGEYISGGDGYGDDLIRWYNELGYITVDVVWECSDTQSGDPCYNTPFAGWVPMYTYGTGWFRSTGGAGYAGASSRTRALIEWILANNGGKPVGAHGHSSGSGRLMTTLTRYHTGTLFDTVVFDGGPVFAYIPWYCGITDDGDPANGLSTPGPLGPKPPQYDIEAHESNGVSGFRDNYDNARDPDNGEGDSPYRNCTNSAWDETAMMADSNFYQAQIRDFPAVDMTVVLGGADRSPASPHARLWFQGYTYGGERIPPLSAKSLTIYQGYCTDSNGTYKANTNTYPCTDWDLSQFPTANTITYLSELGKVEHSTAQSREGATALFNAMRATLELAPP